jgi:preprotein translocase subunit SecA
MRGVTPYTTMISNLIKKIVGTKNERELKRIQPIVEATGSFEEEMKALTDDGLISRKG